MRKPTLWKLAISSFLAGSLTVLGIMVTYGSNTPTPDPTTHRPTTPISVPPSCGAPTGPFQNIWVTITKVTANVSATAAPTGSGWVTLVDLTSNPRQIDLLSLSTTNCLLKQLGTNSPLPAGAYQQVRVHLLANNASSGPSVNQCGLGNGFNCVVPTGGIPQELQWGGEAQTDINTSQAQIRGGKVSLAAEPSADLVIDYNACSSIEQKGDGQYHWAACG